MGIRFVIGRSGAGKSDWILSDIKKQIREFPQGPPLFYLVPDQMTFQQEYKLFKDEDIQGSIRAQIVSFSRLAWRVLQETGGGTRRFISSIGIQMALRKIMEEHAEDWKVFQQAKDKQGFLQQIEQIIKEFKRYQLTPEHLRHYIRHIQSFVHQTPEEKNFVRKLDDLVIIYDALVTQLKDQSIDAEDQMDLLAEKIGAAKSLKNAKIYIDGFHRLTPQEIKVVEMLMIHCQEVTIGLTLDPSLDDDPSDLDLFYQTSETYQALKSLAAINDIEIHDHIMLHPEQNGFYDRPYFSHLERYFDERPAPAYEGKVPLQIAEAVHPRAEIEGVAKEIIRLTREENYRYRDMAIFIRQPDVYHDLLETIFTDYGIPLFIDEKRTMLHHPLIECIRSLFDMIEGNWRYDAVFRLLKTGFIPQTDEDDPLTADAIDQLENYVLEYGIRYRDQWVSDEDWIFQRFRGFDQTVKVDEEIEMEKKINAYRRQVVRAISPYDKKLKNAKTVRARCTILYEFLEALNVPIQLEKVRNTFAEEGKHEQALEQEQVWEAVMNLLDEMVDIAGDEKMSFQTFRTSMDAGFETLTFSHVPPSMDHVIVGAVAHSRISGIKCAFLLGVNEGMWPMKPPADGIISEMEREQLKEHGIQLAESSKRQLLDDWFYMYLAFTSAQDKLWVSYLLSDVEGNSQIRSQLVDRLRELFPNHGEIMLLQDPDEIEADVQYITTPEKTISILTAQLARLQKGYRVHDIWKYVLNWYMTNEPKFERTYHVLQSVFYENKTTQLSEKTVRQIYPKEVRTSVSRLETYHRCSFQYFAAYSLGLNERKTYRLDAPDIGQLFHEALKMITEWVQKDGRELSSLTEKDASKYAHRAITDLGPVLNHQILYSSNRYQYIQRKLQDVIARATYILSEQARKSHFKPVGIEVDFGKGGSLKPITIPLPTGYELVLQGRIDRVDQAKHGDHLYLRIIDYKSSKKDLPLVEVYYGLAMQMLAYLDVVLSQSEEWLGLKASPAGLLYFHVHDAMINSHEPLSDAQIMDKVIQSYKMQGVVLSDEEIVQMMDQSLTSGSSQIIPVGLKKNGGFYKYSHVASEQTFELLQKHIHELIKQTGIEMTQGKVELNPYEHKQTTACKFCPFKAVCQFDQTLPENKTRKLRDMKDEDVLSLLTDRHLQGEEA